MAETAPPSFDFKVELQKTKTMAAVGMNLSFPEKKMLRVNGVKEAGLVTEWNKANASKPELIVKEGDLIVGVNGVHGDSDKMMEKLRDNKLMLFIKREQQEVPATAPEPVIVQKEAPAETKPDPPVNPVVVEVAVEPAAEQEPEPAAAPVVEVKEEEEALTTPATIVVVPEGKGPMLEGNDAAQTPAPKCGYC